MNRQYVGARYVPKFFDNNGSNEWVQGISYEALTIVTYLNTSYTSKKPVPANIGTPNINPAYWCVTGNYNAQVESYRQEVEQIGSEFSDIKANTVNLVMFGDSFLDGGGWGNYLASFLNAKTSHNYGVAGSGFAREGFSSFQNQLDTALQQLSKQECNDITMVVIGGGINDQWDNKETLFNSANNFFHNVRTSFPNAKVYYFPNWGSRPMSKNYVVITDGIGQKAISNGCVYLPNIKYKLISAGSFYINSDKIHPTLAGHDILAKSIFNAINGNTYDYLAVSTYSKGVVKSVTTRVENMVSFECVINVTESGQYKNGLLLGNLNVGTTDENINLKIIPIFDTQGAYVGQVNCGTLGIQLWNVHDSVNPASFSFTMCLDDVAE